VWELGGIIVELHKVMANRIITNLQEVKVTQLNVFLHQVFLLRFQSHFPTISCLEGRECIA